MKSEKYDYSAAAQRIKDLRSKVIAQKGETVEGLSLIDTPSKQNSSSRKSAAKVQEIN